MAQIVPTATIRQAIVNKRELEYGRGTSTKNVNLTTVDVGGSNDVVSAAITANSPIISNGYNGVVYVLTTRVRRRGIQWPTQLNAILLKNGTTTPAANDSNGNPVGFTVVSDNGIYVQGDYNTTNIMIAGKSSHNPAAILGDAVTAVSAGWDPTKSSLPIGSREPTASPATSGDISTGGVNPPSSGTPNGLTIQAAILTGNTPTTIDFNSGGVQNLVRMEEDWWTPQLTLTLNGSLGQLFSSKYFTGPYVSNALLTGPGTINDKVYTQPLVRNVLFDSQFNDYSPASTPKTTNYSRGDFFNW